MYFYKFPYEKKTRSVEDRFVTDPLISFQNCEHWVHKDEDGVIDIFWTREKEDSKIEKI